MIKTMTDRYAGSVKDLMAENHELRERLRDVGRRNIEMSDQIAGLEEQVAALLKVNKRDADNLLGKQMENEQ
jgi:hypothetical protein